jgi:putative glutamine amidotransferase
VQPLIGITTSFERGEQCLSPAYALSVERSGGLCVLLPHAAERMQADALVARLDGLILPGGPAIMDGLIGELPDDIDAPTAARLKNERWVLEGALQRGLPILGVCHGMQLVNGYLGGSIYADVERQCGLKTSHSEKRGGVDHGLETTPGSRFASLFPEGLKRVNTRHIQAIAELGTGLTVSARAPDGVIEAVESADGGFVGVQFHPERDYDNLRPLFDDLVARAVAHRQASPGD